jgi:hypothetical protein
VIRWVDRQMRIWWPAVAAIVAGAILATLGFVVATVVDDRSQLRDQRDQLALLVEQQAEIIERNRRADATGQRRLAQAIHEVESILVAQFAEHDHNVAVKLNDLLAQIAALLDRPAGVVRDPVVAQPLSPPPTAPATARPVAPSAPHQPRTAPTTSQPRPTTTTTTTPDQRRCADNPDHPRC